MSEVIELIVAEKEAPATPQASEPAPKPSRKPRTEPAPAFVRIPEGKIGGKLGGSKFHLDESQVYPIDTFTNELAGRLIQRRIVIVCDADGIPV